MARFKATVTGQWTALKDFGRDSVRIQPFGIGVRNYNNDAPVQLTFDNPADYADPEQVPVEWEVDGDSQEQYDNRPFRGILYGRRLEGSDPFVITITFW